MASEGTSKTNRKQNQQKSQNKEPWKGRMRNMQSETLAKCHATALSCFFCRFTFRESLMPNLLIFHKLMASTDRQAQSKRRPSWTHAWPMSKNPQRQHPPRLRARERQDDSRHSWPLCAEETLWASNPASSPQWQPEAVESLDPVSRKD